MGASAASPAQPGQQPADHAPVDGTDHRVLGGGVAEGAVLGHHGRGLAAVLGVGGEAVGGEGVGDGVHGGAHRALSFARLHALGEDASVVLADPFGHALGFDGAEELEGLGQQRHEQVVEVGDEVEGRDRRRCRRRPGSASRAARRRPWGSAPGSPRGTRRRPAGRDGGGPRSGAARTRSATSDAVAPGCDRT